MHKQTLEPKENTDLLLEVIGIAKREERKGRALAVSIRLEALATHIANKDMSGKEAAELLRREATRYENESQELH
ncbi:DUF2732 domain-containing protein [Klebsiella pneumoniae]|uniref:DUF2732 domain-containing protein n=1 Tax=Klebsiella pneumoniae subsp. pneumoniae (strain HS11286) TaxID=1125630 RepID=A0A0H3H1P1_KLEPH|nr:MULTISPECIES: DUF2732 family protein [Klebsiella/Raoultella group]YP_005228306.1 DUF2732 domain-containing protein [Klebsiella pneumoniae subsp. pneumoniae HS11286]UMX51781.1 DUF2732 domain-containing protein [Escherichia coli]AEW62704.1 hypothetical protein KPHS_40060 [Klebsiella pneumoniae subsp. pneumoniae HS11286]AUH86767.1 DUF2732 domain-containing protein [Klebsiella pneumoniae]MBC4633117.1 DUF2732 domain-containing protein [Klebsiella pneumoniae]MBW8648993.1 DUF2732 domain-containin